MKIWNGYYKMYVDLNKNLGHSATWEQGFNSGFIIGFLLTIFTISIMVIQ